MKKQYIAVAIIFLIMSYIVYSLWRRGKRLNRKIKTLTKKQEISSFKEIDMELNEPNPGLNFMFSVEPSVDNVQQKMGQWETAGIVYSTDPLDHTVLTLTRKLIFPGQDIGHPEDDTSTYAYRVVDKDGIAIELPRNTYSQLLDGDKIATIPGMEGKGEFTVNLYDNRYINVIM